MIRRMGRRAKPAKVKAKAKRRLVRKAPTKEAARVHEIEKRLAEALEKVKAMGVVLQEKDRALTEAHAQVTEALERQTATAEILRVISSSPTDVQPVLDAIAERAVHLSEAMFGSVMRREGDWLHSAAHYNYPPEEAERRAREFPLRIEARPHIRRVMETGEVVHLTDPQHNPVVVPEVRERSRELDTGTILMVPLLREGITLGVISVTKREPTPFAEKHIELLKTFADQAVIAIENVSLFS